jgi:hypothetical protein
VWRFIDDPSALAYLWHPLVRNVAIGWTLHRQNREYLDSGYYREIESPFDCCWLLDAMIGYSGRTIGFVHPTRPRHARPFTSDDVQRLDRLRPWIAHAFRQPATDNAWQEDEAFTNTSGRIVRMGQLIVTPDARLLHQTAGVEFLLRILGGEPTVSMRNVPMPARAGTRKEASPADHRCREWNVQHATSRADFDRLWYCNTRSPMAPASGRAPGRRCQRSKVLPLIGNDRAARAGHCPRRAPIA